VAGFAVTPQAHRWFDPVIKQKNDCMASGPTQSRSSTWPPGAKTILPEAYLEGGNIFGLNTLMEFLIALLFIELG